MRLTIFGPGNPFRGGIASTTTSLVQALGAGGHQVQFVTPTRQYPQWLYPGGGDQDPEACPRLEWAEALFSPLEPWTWPRARRRALEWAGDYWIFPYWTWVWAPWWMYLLKAKNRPPAIGVVHNPVDHESSSFRRRAAEQVLSRCDGLFTHAQVLAQELAASFPDQPIGHHVLPPPVQRGEACSRKPARERLGVSPDEFLALFFGLIRPYKGVDVLLDAMAELGGQSSWRLIVAGEPWGDLGKDLPAQVQRLDLGNRVELRLKWISEREVEEFLAAADLVILPYRSGTQSAVAPLALSRGVPVLSTRVGGLGEMVEHGVNGLLVGPGSADELSKGLENLLGEGRLSALASGARASMKKWTWDGYAEALGELIGTTGRIE
ncbi:MAG: glycosyltransferase family 4 protein [Thermoanaerobaculales bacterium]|nr:glycosyltransferase family 4 protein [Thermoanaerobaculales bacterium]